jgi:CRP/FNR family transcriptional regulator, cyclic AMP receptor protein
MAKGSSKQVLDSLAKQPVFARCSKKELEAVARIGTSILIEPGYVLTREGRRGYEFFVILEGEATCTIDGEQVNTLGAGDFFGEVALLDSQGTRSATIVATTAMKVIVIDSREFSGMIGDAPSAARQIMGKLAERLRNSQTTA